MRKVYLESEEDALTNIRVSRDGTLAAYTSNESGRSEVYIRSFPDPGAQTQVSQGGGQFPFWSPDGNTVHYWTIGASGQATFMAARIQRNPTPVVLSRDSLFTGNYLLRFSDLHPIGSGWWSRRMSPLARPRKARLQNLNDSWSS